MISEQILADKEYQNAMRRIDAACKPGLHPSYDSWHGLSHAKSVMRYAVDFLKQVGGDEYVIELAKIAALLHDIALQNGDKGDHAKSGAEMTQKYLRKFDMPDDDVGLICHAIEFHTAGEEIRNNLDAAILLGDKLDVDHIRCRVVAHGAIQTYMMLIDGIKFQVGHKVATLKYSVNDKFDVNSLKVWPKAVTIPAKIAGFLGKGFVFQINDKRYTEQEFLEVVK